MEVVTMFFGHLILIGAGSNLFPRYPEVSRDRNFLIEFDRVEWPAYEEDQFKGVERRLYIKLINPNIHGVRETLSILFKAFSEKDLKLLSNYIGKDFYFSLSLDGADQLRAYGWKKEWSSMAFRDVFFRDFEGRIVYEEWKGEEALKKLLSYVPVGTILAALSNGYYVMVDYRTFNKILHGVSYEELYKRIGLEELEPGKGTYWASAPEMSKLFNQWEVSLPYYWGNLYIPDKCMKKPPSEYGKNWSMFLPPPIWIRLKWNRKKDKWELNGISYGWVEIDY